MPFLFALRNTSTRAISPRSTVPPFMRMPTLFFDATRTLRMMSPLGERGSLSSPFGLPARDPCAQRCDRRVAQFRGIDDRAVGRGHGNLVEIVLGQLFDRLALEHDLLAVDLANLPDRRVMRLAARARPFRARNENPADAARRRRSYGSTSSRKPRQGWCDVENIVAAPFAFALLHFLWSSVAEGFRSSRPARWRQWRDGDRRRPARRPPSFSPSRPQARRSFEVIAPGRVEHAVLSPSARKHSFEFDRRATASPIAYRSDCAP